MRCRHKWGIIFEDDGGTFWCIKCGTLKIGRQIMIRQKCGCTMIKTIYKYRKPKLSQACMAARNFRSRQNKTQQQKVDIMTFWLYVVCKLFM